MNFKKKYKKEVSPMLFLNERLENLGKYSATDIEPKECINENLLTEGATTYLVTDNIDGKTWKFGVYTKNNKEAKYLQNLSTKGGSRRFNLEDYSDGKDEIEGCDKTLTLDEFIKKIEDLVESINENTTFTVWNDEKGEKEALTLTNEEQVEFNKELIKCIERAIENGAEKALDYAEDDGEEMEEETEMEGEVMINEKKHTFRVYLDAEYTVNLHHFYGSYEEEPYTEYEVYLDDIKTASIYGLDNDDYETEIPDEVWENLGYSHPELILTNK